MEHLMTVSYFLGALGIFFMGIAALWFVSVYNEKAK